MSTQECKYWEDQRYLPVVLVNRCREMKTGKHMGISFLVPLRRENEKVVLYTGKILCSGRGRYQLDVHSN